jgi:hypothetical protein
MKNNTIKQFKVELALGTKDLMWAKIPEKEVWHILLNNPKRCPKQHTTLCSAEIPKRIVWVSRGAIPTLYKKCSNCVKVLNREEV